MECMPLSYTMTYPNRFDEISGRLPGSKNEVCWIVRRFAPLDVAETKSIAKKKKSVVKKKRAPQLAPA